MKSLAYTLQVILDELPFGPGPNYQVAFPDPFNNSLAEAIDLYSKSRAEALELLRRSKDLDKNRPECVAADFEEVAASCGHFSFSLEDFAREMQTYLNILDELKVEVEGNKTRSWQWIRFWGSSRRDMEAPKPDDGHHGE
jgi:hypothetical protein